MHRLIATTTFVVAAMALLTGCPHHDPIIPVADPTVPLSPPSPPAVTQSAIGSCSDPNITAAVEANTHQSPVGMLCDTSVYGPDMTSANASDRANAAYRVLHVCSDPWVTQAVMQTLGRNPTGDDCDINKYGANWGNDFQLLEMKVELANGFSQPMPIVAAPASGTSHYQVLDVGTGPYLRHPGVYGVGGNGSFVGMRVDYPTLKRVHLYLIFWGTRFGSSGGLELVRYLTAAAKTMIDPAAGYTDQLKQYQGIAASAPAPGGTVAWFRDSRSDPPNSFAGLSGPFDTMGEIDTARTENRPGVPFHWTPDGTDDPIVVVFEPHASLNGLIKFGGYHYWLDDSTPAGAGQMGWMPYIVVDVPDGTDGTDDAFAVDQNGIREAALSLSHEYVEAVTNPMPLYGWADWGQAVRGPLWQTAEPADICERGTPYNPDAEGIDYPGGAAYPTYDFWFAEYWDNAADACKDH